MEFMGPGFWLGWNGILPDVERPNSLHVPHADVITNARLKLYMDKGVMQVANDNIFPTGDYEANGWKKRRKRPYDVSKAGEALDPQRSFEESM